MHLVTPLPEKFKKTKNKKKKRRPYPNYAAVLCLDPDSQAAVVRIFAGCGGVGDWDLQDLERGFIPSSRQAHRVD